MFRLLECGVLMLAASAAGAATNHSLSLAEMLQEHHLDRSVVSSVEKLGVMTADDLRHLTEPMIKKLWVPQATASKLRELAVEARKAHQRERRGEDERSGAGWAGTHAVLTFEVLLRGFMLGAGACVLQDMILRPPPRDGDPDEMGRVLVKHIEMALKRAVVVGGGSALFLCGLSVFIPVALRKRWMMQLDDV